MKKILIINDTADHSNWGSQACAGALRTILGDVNSDASITILSNTMLNKRYAFDPKFMGVRVCGAADPANPIRRVISKQCVPVPLVVDQFDEIATKWMAADTKGTAEYMEKLKDIDAIVFNAEGSTYRINYGSMKALFILWMAKVKLGIPAYFLNGSVTMTCVDPIFPAMLNTTFKVLDGIAVREPFSLRNVQEFVPGVAAEMVPDSVFYFAPTVAEEPIGEKNQRIKEYCKKPFFCFSLSMLPVDYTAGRKESA
ncbi:MAG: hypothetical protein KAI74_05950, partial [Kiritimatiellae bacterium]|nr:hypothetical protein [Kiritimatiellia bacterium]